MTIFLIFILGTILFMYFREHRGRLNALEDWKQSVEDNAVLLDKLNKLESEL